MPGTVRRLSMKNHHSSGKHRLLKQVIMLCLVLVLVCSMSISTFAVNTDGRINRAGQESTQIMEESKETSVANEKDLQTEQEKKKTSEDSSESQTKKENETTKEESEDKDNTQDEKDFKETDTKEEVTEDNSKKEAAEEEKKTESKKSEGIKDVSEEATKTLEEKTTEAAEKSEEATQTESDKNKEIAVKESEDKSYSGPAAIYYLANPTGDPWTNDTGAWAPSQETSNTLANINTTGATWKNGYVGNTVYENKNIKSNVASYITSWPDSSTGSTWTVKRDNNTTGRYFTFILNSIWESYKSSVARELGIDKDELNETDITEITLTPRKISRDNGGTYPYHIDCALSIKSTKIFTAKFWVKNPGESEYTQVDAKNYRKESAVEETKKATIGSTIKKENGVTYVLDGWYPENESGGACGNDRITSWSYTPSEKELVDGTVNFYAHYSPMPSIKLKKLVTGNMGDRTKKFHFTISIKKGNENVTFKVGNASKEGSVTVDLANNEESTLTEIPVGANVTIIENDYSESGYTTSYQIDNVGNNTDANPRVAEISNIQAKDNASAYEVVFTNHKEATPDTGITLDSLPFITLLALSIAGGIFYLICRYKKRFV